MRPSNYPQRSPVTPLQPAPVMPGGIPPQGPHPQGYGAPQMMFPCGANPRQAMNIPPPASQPPSMPMKSPRAKTDIPPPTSQPPSMPMKSPRTKMDIPPPTSQPPSMQMKSPRTKADIPPPASQPPLVQVKAQRTKSEIPPPSSQPPLIQMKSPRTKSTLSPTMGPSQPLNYTNIPPHPHSPAYSQPLNYTSIPSHPHSPAYSQQQQQQQLYMTAPHPTQSPVYPQQQQQQMYMTVPPNSQSPVYPQQQVYMSANSLSPRQPPIQMPSPQFKTIPSPSMTQVQALNYTNVPPQSHSPTYPQQCLPNNPQQGYMNVQMPSPQMTPLQMSASSPTDPAFQFDNEEGRQMLPNLDDMSKLYGDSYKKHRLSTSLRNMGMLDYAGVSDYCKKFVVEKEASGVLSKYETSIEESMGIAIYTYEDNSPEDCPFRVINTCLGRIRTMEALEKIKDVFFNIVSGLRKLPRFYPPSKTLYRGIRERVDLEMYTRGNVVTWSAFSSASTDMSVIRNFLMSSGDASGTMFIIQGDPWGYDITDFSFFDDEKEILMEPDRRFEVSSVMDQGQLVIIELKMLETPLVIEDLVPPVKPLADGWSFQKDLQSGKIFYVNNATRKTQWERPSAPSGPVLPAGWAEAVDPASGRKYYVEMATGKTQWEHPGGSLSLSQSSQQTVIPIPVGFKPATIYVDGVTLVWNPVRVANIVYIVECSDVSPSLSLSSSSSSSNCSEFFPIYCGASPSCTCKDLRPGLRYIFRVRACVGTSDDIDEIGRDPTVPKSDWSQPLEVAIPVVPPPVNLVTTDVNASVVGVSWEPPPAPILVPGNIGYQVRRTLGQQNSIAYEGNALRFACRDIQAGFSYTFSVRAFCNGVFSQWSKPVATQATAICLQYAGVFKEGPNYTISSDRRVATTKLDSWSSNIVGDRPIPVDVVVKWTIKILETYNSGDAIFIGVAPQSVDVSSNNNRRECGWYFCCYDSSLYSGPPYNYGEYFGERYASTGSLRKGDEVSVYVDMSSRAISFYINGKDYGVAYKNIPVNEPLVPIVILNYMGDSVKLIP